MPAKKNINDPTIQLTSPDPGWDIQPIASTEPAIRRRGERTNAHEDDILPAFLRGPEFEELTRGTATPAARRRGEGAAAGSSLALTAPVPDDAAVLLVVRQVSGAVSFHRPTVTTPTAVRRGVKSAAGGMMVHFEIPVLDGDAVETGRRGIIGKVIKMVLIKVAKKLVGTVLDHATEWVVEKLSRQSEEYLWRNRPQGWLRITRESLGGNTLQPGVPGFPASERGLLLIHGIFSNAAACFGGLAEGRFFDEVTRLYDSNIFAYNHFTYSKTPIENVKEFLDALPDRDLQFDVVCHSRGGLVLRELLEGSGRQHPKFQRLKIGKVILAAVPCGGSPLASPDGWDKKLSFLANLLELIPDNPLTDAAAFLTDALAWFAQNIGGHITGGVAMDPMSPFIDQLQDPPDAPAGTLYYALTSNFHPPQIWWARLMDMGVDNFFGRANDLVVWTDGVWKTGHEHNAWIPAARIGCFGPGGNLCPELPDAAHHLNFFDHPRTTDYILGVLSGTPLSIPAIDPLAPLPSRSLVNRRSAAPVALRTDADAAPPTRTPPPGPPTVTTHSAHPKAETSGWDVESELSLTVVSHTDYAKVEREDSSPAVPLLIARYGSARVVVPFYTRGTDDNAGLRWRQIIACHRQLLSYANGEETAFEPGSTESPSAAFLEDFGEVLFRTLFPTEVRSLYNIARFLHEKRRLKIIFTSMIPWVADIPWEFAFDRPAGSFLSCTDVRFVRNVLTSTPTSNIKEKTTALRILVVSAQPSELGRLSIEDERRGIYESFRPLIDAGLVEVEVLASATPGLLHERLRYQADEADFDVLHFIGHGEFDEKARTGYLIFQDDTGNSHRVSSSTFLNIVQGRNIRVVFLNACETGHGEKADYNRGVAMALVRDGIPAVVANQYSVIDRSASQFSLHFYSCLAKGLNLADAMREARIAMLYCGVELIDWGVPVLFANNPDARLCQSTALSTAPAVGGGLPPAFNVLSRPAAALRGGTGIRRTDVAVWDAENSLVYRENLPATLEELNAAQDSFTFRIERFSAPRSLWTPDKDKNTDDVAYMSAEKVLGRMERIRKAISKSVRTDFLFCVTNLPLRDADTTALYYLSAERITILSTWGLNPPLEGIRLKQALASHLAMALLQFLREKISKPQNGNNPVHPIHTIGYFNDERSVDHITGRMTITSDTMARIQHDISVGKLTEAQFQAIQTLLAHYHQP